MPKSLEREPAASSPERSSNKIQIDLMHNMIGADSITDESAAKWIEKHAEDFRSILEENASLKEILLHGNEHEYQQGLKAMRTHLENY